MARGKTGLFMFMVLAPLAIAPPAAARAPINVWLCKVLKPPFDPVAAIASFPLEKLPPATETREEEKDEEKDRTLVSVTVGSEGEHFTVEFGYRFRSDNVSDPYGFHLDIDANYPQPANYKDEGEKWLAEFGKPERSSMGRAVYAGPEIYEGGDPVFRFERSPLTGSYGAGWWSRGDMRYAAELCK